MSNLTGFVKRLRDIMRNDAGINGDAQRIEQIAWMLFLKVYDAKEQDWAWEDENYQSIIPQACRWQNWAHDDKSGKAMTGDKLLGFVNNTLFPVLKGKDVKDASGKTIVEGIRVTAQTPIKKAIVQTVDILAPIVNDAFWFGRIAACNALSDVYALGGQPWCAMNVAFFPTCLTENDPENILANILRGGMDALEEAGAVLAGGHTVQDDELKYGMAVTGIIDPDHVAANDKLRPGLRLLLTKPLGTGILATGVKARWDDHEESEALLQRWCGRLNRIPGEAIAHFRIPAATDITGFGLGGHLLEMAQASGVCVSLQTEALPLLPHALEYARMGLIPAGSHLNRTHCAPAVDVAPSVDEAVESIVFDAQTSGGIVLAVPGEELATVRDWLEARGEMAVEIGEVLEARPDGKRLLLR